MKDASRFYKNTEEGVKIMYDRYNEVYAEGMDEGLRIGRTEGINIGRAEGIAIGRKQAVLETSVRMAAAYIRKYHESVSEAAADIGMSEEEFLKTAEMLGINIR